MTSSDVRASLVHALRLDVVGPEANDPLVAETLNVPPSRWYLTGFLVPWSAPVQQKRDEDDSQGDLGFAEAATQADEDDRQDEAPAARRGHFPSSIGISVLVPADATGLRVTARWGDYAPREVGPRPDVMWDRRERQENIVVRLDRRKPQKVIERVPGSDGLEVVTSVRSVRRAEELPGLPAGTRAVSVFLVNRRTPIEGREELKDRTFAFQAGLTLEADRPFVPRPNPRGREGADTDERIGDLQYRDVMEYASGHGTSTRASVASGACSRVETTWVPQAEVERVEPELLPGVELGMEALAAAADAATLRARLAPITKQYRAWIEDQRTAAPNDARQRDVAEGLVGRAELAAARIDAGLALLDNPVVLDAFRIANRHGARENDCVSEQQPQGAANPARHMPMVRLAFQAAVVPAGENPAERRLCRRHQSPGPASNSVPQREVPVQGAEHAADRRGGRAALSTSSLLRHCDGGQVREPAVDGRSGRAARRGIATTRLVSTAHGSPAWGRSSGRRSRRPISSFRTSCISSRDRSARWRDCTRPPSMRCARAESMDV